MPKHGNVINKMFCLVNMLENHYINIEIVIDIHIELGCDKYLRVDYSHRHHGQCSCRPFWSTLPSGQLCFRTNWSWKQLGAETRKPSPNWDRETKPRLGIPEGKQHLRCIFKSQLGKGISGIYHLHFVG